MLVLVDHALMRVYSCAWLVMTRATIVTSERSHPVAIDVDQTYDRAYHSS